MVIYLNLHTGNVILKQMENKVLDILKKSENPLKSGEISDLTGLDKKDVDKMIKKLKEEDKIFSPKRCFYTVKK